MTEIDTDDLLRRGDYVLTPDNGCLLVYRILDNGIVECIDWAGRLESYAVEDVEKAY